MLSQKNCKNRCFKKKFCKRKKKKRIVRDNSFKNVDLVDDDTTSVKYLESVELNTLIERNLFLCHGNANCCVDVRC